MVSERVSIPTIGIGASPGCDARVQVFHDLLGFYDDQRKLRHAKRYAVVGEVIRNALAEYAAEVESGSFPTAEHSVSMAPESLAELTAANPHLLDAVVLAEVGTI